MKPKTLITILLLTLATALQVFIWSSPSEHRLPPLVTVVAWILFIGACLVPIILWHRQVPKINLSYPQYLKRTLGILFTITIVSAIAGLFTRKVGLSPEGRGVVIGVILPVVFFPLWWILVGKRIKKD